MATATLVLSATFAPAGSGGGRRCRVDAERRRSSITLMSETMPVRAGSSDCARRAAWSAPVRSSSASMRRASAKLASYARLRTSGSSGCSLGGVGSDRRQQRLGHRVEVGEALLGILVERAQRDRREPVGKPQRLGVERMRRRGHDLRHQARDRGRLERTPPRDHLVEDHADGPHVGAVVDLASLQQLGREVARGPEHHSRLREVGVGRLAAGPARDAEVEDLDRPVVREPDVRGLDVAVDDAHAMGEVEPAADVDHHPHLLLEPVAVGRRHRLDRGRSPRRAPSRCSGCRRRRRSRRS